MAMDNIVIDLSRVRMYNSQCSVTLPNVSILFLNKLSFTQSVEHLLHTFIFSCDNAYVLAFNNQREVVSSISFACLYFETQIL